MKQSNKISITGQEIRSNYLANCSATTFWRMRKRDTSFPKPIKLGGLLLWDRKEIENWYDQIKSTGGTNA